MSSKQKCKPDDSATYLEYLLLKKAATDIDLDRLSVYGLLLLLAYTDVFDAMDNLITYRIDSVRKQAPLKLLIQI